MKKAFAYLRTSSAANVGGDKDSDKRQREAIAAYAAHAGYEIIEEFYDAAVSGADPVDERAGFAAMLTRIAGNGVRVILVETANRFARDLIVQETGHRHLRRLGIELIAVDSPDSFTHDTPTAVMVRQILGAVAQFEKASLVAKLQGARRRTGRYGGRQEQSHAKLRPEVVSMARALRGKGLTLRAVAAQLDAAGFKNEAGRPYAPDSVWAMNASPEELRERATRRTELRQARRKAAGA